MAPPPRSVELSSPSPNRILVAVQPVLDLETVRVSEVMGMLRFLEIKFTRAQQISMPADATHTAGYVNVFAIEIDLSAPPPSTAGPSGVKGPLPGEKKKADQTAVADFASNAAAVGDRDDYMNISMKDPMQAHAYMMQKGQEQNDPVEFAAKRIENYPGDERILKCQPDLKSRMFAVTVTDRVTYKGFLEIAYTPTKTSSNPGGYAMQLDDTDLGL